MSVRDNGVAKMKVTVLTGPQGSGKSTVMREQAIAQPGLYLFAAPTHELIDEQTAAFKAEKRGLKLWPVHSKTGGKGKVEERLEHARSEIVREGHRHAVILTTHDAMMGSDLSLFAGWHARIDEAPAAVQAGSFNISEVRAALKERFAEPSARFDERPEISCPFHRRYAGQLLGKIVSEAGAIIA